MQGPDELPFFIRLFGYIDGGRQKPVILDKCILSLFRIGYDGKTCQPIRPKGGKSPCPASSICIPYPASPGGWGGPTVCRTERKRSSTLCPRRGWHRRCAGAWRAIPGWHTGSGFSPLTSLSSII